MSRSYKHSPFHGNTCSESEKQDKKGSHKSLRVREQSLLSSINIDTSDDDNLIEPDILDVSNAYTFAKDGKQRLQQTDPNFEKLMRK